MTDESQCCKNCIAYAVAERANTSGTCRADGPRGQIIPKQDAITPEMKFETHGFWPPVREHNWCRRFSPRLVS